jgi:hypothetical protein
LLLLAAAKHGLTSLEGSNKLQGSAESTGTFSIVLLEFILAHEVLDGAGAVLGRGCNVRWYIMGGRWFAWVCCWNWCKVYGQS